jgi:4-hydroxy-tetrahydrodipicolinate reductase
MLRSSWLMAEVAAVTQQAGPVPFLLDHRGADESRRNPGAHPVGGTPLDRRVGAKAREATGYGELSTTAMESTPPREVPMSPDTSPPIRVVLAGATGWAGSALARGIVRADDIELVGAVSRSRAGEQLDDVLGTAGLPVTISATAVEALQSRPDVLVEYTHPSVALRNTLDALEAGAHVVVGTSGLSVDDYRVVDEAATRRGLGVLACGNFALTAVLMMKFSEMAASWVKSWEVIDYASAGKVDAPSGTARELADRLAALAATEPPKEILGDREARGAAIEGTQVHSLRLPSYVIAVESIFGQEDERLTLRHDAGPSAEPYVTGALLAIRNVSRLVGLRRGLDTVMGIDGR